MFEDENDGANVDGGTSGIGCMKVQQNVSPENNTESHHHYGTTRNEGSREQSKRSAWAAVLHHQKTKSLTDSNSINSRGDESCSTSNSIGNATFGSLSLLSKRFLQLYLVGYDSFSLGEATHQLLLRDKLHQTSNVDDSWVVKNENTKITGSMKHQVAATIGMEESKVCKTKLRRLYDITNVLVSIGVIKKTTKSSLALDHSSFTNTKHVGFSSSSLNIDKDVGGGEGEGRADGDIALHKNNQYFSWNYRSTPREILDCILKHNGVGVPLSKAEYILK